MTDVRTYQVVVEFHGIRYYGTVKSELGPNAFLTNIANTGDSGDGFKFAFPGEPIEF